MSFFAMIALVMLGMSHFVLGVINAQVIRHQQQATLTTDSESNARSDINIAALQPSPSALHLSTTPDSDVDTIHITMIGDASEVVQPLFIWQTSTITLSNIFLMAYLNNEEGQPLSGVTFNFSGGYVNSDAGASTITIAPDERRSMLMFRLTNITANGIFTGYIVAQSQGQIIYTIPLKVVRRPHPQLKIIEATSTGIELIQHDAEFVRVLHIESVNQADVAAMQPMILPLIGPTDQQVELTWDLSNRSGEKSIKMLGLSVETLTLRATLPLTGEYKSAITLVYENKRETLPLQITRVQPPPSIDVSGMAIVRNTVLWPGWLGGGNIEFWLTLRETGGQKVTLGRPMLSALEQRGGSDGQSQYQAQYAGLFLIDENTPSAMRLLCDTPEQPEKALTPLTLNPGQSQVLKLRIKRLLWPGEYTGQLRLSAADRAAIVMPLTLLVREPIWLAMLLIVVSVLASYFLQSWQQDVRIRKERQIEIADNINRLSQQAQQKLSAEELDPLTGLSAMLERLYSTPDLGIRTTATAEIQMLRTKVERFPDLVNSRRRIDALRDSLHNTPILNPIINKMDEVREAFKSSATNSITQLETSLGELKNLLDQAPMDVLKQDIQSFKTTVAEVLNRMKPNTDAALTEITLQLDRLAQNVTLATLATYQKDFEQLRANYVDAVVKNLTSRLGAPPLTITGSAQADNEKRWESVKTAVQPLLAAIANVNDVDKKIEKFQAAEATYINSLLIYLNDTFKVVKKQIELDIKNGQIIGNNKDKAENLKQEIDALLASMAKNQGSPTMLNESLKESAQVVTKIKTLWELVPATSSQQMGVDTVAVMAASGGSPLITMPAKPVEIQDIALWTPTIAQARITELGQQLAWGNRLVFVITLIVAILLGLQLLWLDDPTWGGWQDYIVAILWGFGLHQVSNSAFQGLRQLRTNLTTAPVQTGGQG